MAGFLEKYVLKVAARAHIFCRSHMKPGQSLLYSTTVLYDSHYYAVLYRGNKTLANW